MKKIILGIGLCGILATTGCLPVVIAGITAVGTVAAGRAKYMGDLEKAKSIETFRDEVTADLKEIKAELEKNKPSEPTP